MKKVITFLYCLLFTVMAFAAKPDSTLFKGYLYNAQYEVYLRINFYENDVTIPHYEDLYGPLPGFFGDIHDGRRWLITTATIKGRTASIELSNDYGSEDLQATLTAEKDGSFTLRQGKGSTLKIARNRKWVKMPGEMTFVKK
ncbi:MAG: hypothetical protein PUD15_10675 [Prevotella sp.]|uniref:hypothetical protein n=1 Tax=Prevotella sp. AGR2160 TaxID=1280674 RepID=UPI000490E396|nr:hypothetical protein [Prevotella sp. AGR2160]MDD5862996.1 hypothetical protein [Prevotella sp.]